MTQLSIPITHDEVFHIKVGDTGPAIEEALAIDGVPLDLTGCTVQFHMGGPADVTGAADVLGDPTEGLVRYEWGATDTAVGGLYLREWIVTLPSTGVVSVPNYKEGYPVVVEEHPS